jgi:ArsR family transcriptional regulator, arsenate/arsenite/antimonite-responsive transcriptional repressor
MTPSPRPSLGHVVDAVKALAHPGRLRILAMLRGGDLCVCQMPAVLDLAASTVSSHLGDLRRAGFVTERKSGKWVHYHLVGEGPLADLVRQALRLLDGADQLSQDVGVARAVRAVPLDTFCQTGFDRQAASPPARRATRPRATTSSRRRPS